MRDMWLPAQPWRGEWPSSADGDVEDHAEADRARAGVRDPLFGSRGRPAGLVGERDEAGVEPGANEHDDSGGDRPFARSVVG